MRPLHIPKIRALDLTERHWREGLRLTRLYPASPLPRYTTGEVVQFRRPLPGITAEFPLRRP